ncbi:DUF742 domain-containing protein [Streptomyces griseoviridis]|uniref:DUF742 domain-containing protein n=2 Tax=Streptomyces TaxID=1883 RepID=A0A3S9ZK85_STRGD|nr:MULTISPECIES: DUF742 domain-containing protein [Streptomyces]AZS88275.1 DUF742 domain-containing protein [Streptomyces griseoviridis]MDH6702527.1 hypothetical protein [Streptomyces sp. MAA16]MDT0477278.1 DUF742 domain-containing protein [Streptomyces sp. DSM 41014]QCN84881.1 DUF742 domain-containing protein [Streptomyces griseoviridis]
MTPPRRQRRHPVPKPPPSAAAEGEGKIPERLYVVAGPAGDRADLDLVTLIVANGRPSPSATPEESTVIRLCAAPLSVAELSAYLSLPYSSVTVLLTELLMAELVQARSPIVRQALPDRSLLEAVMHGLQRL